MKQPKGWIEAARSQLSEAFSVTESPPWPEQGSEFEPFKLILIPMEPEWRSLFGLEGSEPQELEELEEELGENGTEAVALYLSFHCPLPDTKWGIFLLEDPMWLLRERIRRDFHFAPILQISWHRISFCLTNYTILGLICMPCIKSLH